MKRTYVIKDGDGSMLYGPFNEPEDLTKWVNDNPKLVEEQLGDWCSYEMLDPEDVVKWYEEIS